MGKERVKGAGATTPCAVRNGPFRDGQVDTATWSRRHYNARTDTRLVIQSQRSEHERESANGKVKEEEEENKEKTKVQQEK